MLMVTPETLRFLRNREALQRKAKKRRVSQAYRRRLIDQTAAILRRGEPTYFALEAFMRHGLRSGLCLRGWHWHDADELAKEVISAALNQIGAKRPTWKQGQPEWTQEGVITIERERCIRCGWKLPEGHLKFCSALCGAAQNKELHRRFEAEQVEALYADAP